MKKFIEEFKAFAFRGNVVDLSIGVLIGGAFSALVASFTNDIMISAGNHLPKEQITYDASVLQNGGGGFRQAHMALVDADILIISALFKAGAIAFQAFFHQARMLTNGRAKTAHAQGMGMKHLHLRII